MKLVLRAGRQGGVVGRHSFSSLISIAGRQAHGGGGGGVVGRHSFSSLISIDPQPPPLPLLTPPSLLPHHESLLQSPQLSLKSLPLLASCLPPAPLGPQDHAWIHQHLSLITQVLGFPLEVMQNGSPDSPVFHLDTLLFLAFQHLDSNSAKHVKMGHGRLSFLGQFVVELALAEYFLQRYPRELPACMRERVFGLTCKKVLPQWIKAAGLDGIIFSREDSQTIRPDTRQQTVRAVFWALAGALYLSMGMREVYRLFFEVFGLDPDAESCQPTPRMHHEDEDHVVPEFGVKQMAWQDISTGKTADISLFAKPLLFKACVPPGMKRFRGNLWEIDSLPEVSQILGYPLQTVDEDTSITAARNAELQLGLQICFLHPSMYKREHPRFCNERFEYLGQKIQDVVMAEKLLMKHLDGPSVWLREKHRRLLFNRLCGKYLREKGLHNYILYGKEKEAIIDRNKRQLNAATISVSQALCGLGYAVYGKAEVRRLLFEVFNFERLKHLNSL